MERYKIITPNLAGLLGRGAEQRAEDPIKVRGLRERRTRGSEVALVTVYPSPEQASVHGVASYAQALARDLKASGVDVEVWGDRSSESSRLPEHENGVQVLRLWRKGIVAGLDLWRGLRSRRPAIIHMQIEHFIFGGGLGFLSIMVFLTACRLIRQKVVLTLHHVFDRGDVTREFLRESGLPQTPGVAYRLLQISTVLLCQLAGRVIVHEEVFRQRLRRDYGVDLDRLCVVPHGTPAVAGKRPASRNSRRILAFGYLKWYKGIDIVLRAFRELQDEFPEWKLVIAGGLPFGLKTDHPHRHFLSELSSLAVSTDHQVEFTGYVDDADIPSLFSQADIVVFPYRVLFASSGPLALAIGFRRPFILSESMRALLPSWPIWCRNSPPSWREAMRRLMLDDRMRSEAEAALEVLGADRIWPIIADQTVAAYRELGSPQAIPSHSA
jgi:glycosyltransferase involved in cell wall biosynthesis